MKIDLSRKAEWSERDDLEQLEGHFDLPRQLEIVVDWVGFLRQKNLARHARWGTELAMTDWQTYRNGYPRCPGNMERLARHRAAKLGYRVHRSRRRKGPNNAGELMLIYSASSTVLLGIGYTATIEKIFDLMAREQTQ